MIRKLLRRLKEKREARDVEQRDRVLKNELARFREYHSRYPETKEEMRLVNFLVDDWIWNLNNNLPG